MTFSKFGQGDEWSQKMQDIMDEMRNRHFVQFRREDTWQPATDVYETRDAYLVCVELAGMDPNDVAVECRDQRSLSVQGCRGNPRPADGCGPLSLHAMEINHGLFRREVVFVEPVNIDEVEATYDKGYLWIRLPKIATQ